MELWKHTQAVTANYQKLAEIFLAHDSREEKIDRLLSLEPVPVPEVKKRGYSIWSEGIFAEAFACFPERSFHRLLERLRTSQPNSDTSILFKSLGMWGDEFAAALAGWLDAPEAEIRQKALHGLTLYARQLQRLCNPEAATTEKRLQCENYAEFVRLMRGEEIGAAPASVLLGTAVPDLLEQLRHLLRSDLDTPEQIMLLRCLWQLHHAKSGLVMTPEWLGAVTERISGLAEAASSRTSEREAVIALCHLDQAQGTEYIRTHWFQDAQQRSMAAEMLGMIHTEAAFQMLRTLVADAYPETRRKAIASLESFEPAQALTVLDSLTDSDKKVHRQILRSRSRFTRKRRRPKRQTALYFISPLALLRRVPPQPLFSEAELNARINPEVIADISSSRRYAVELGLLERRGDTYRLSTSGAVIHSVENFLEEGFTSAQSTTTETRQSS